MKSAFSKIVVFILFLVGPVLYGINENPIPVLKFKTTYSDTFVLYVNAYDHAIEVKLLNKTGALLFSENLKKGYSYRKTYDISGLSDGTYYAQIKENTDFKLFCVIKGNRNKITEIEKLPYE